MQSASSFSSSTRPLASSAQNPQSASRLPSLDTALHSEGIKALAAQLQQLFALGVAQFYCCAEAFGYAAHKVVGALVVAGDAVEGEPCPPGAAVPAGHFPRLYHPHACSVRMPP
jgi:hypothetical protein